MSDRLLIVEDDPDLAENLVELCEAQGFSADVCSSAERACERIQQPGYRGIISDYRLPGKSGVDLISLLRHKGCGLPVVLMSAFMDAASVERAEAAGALDILSKPLDLPRLFNLAEEFIAPKHPVLVVEDNEALLENVTEALRDMGLSPLVGRDAESALAHRKLPRVALVDLRLPDQDGVAVARRLFARNPNMRIVYITASDELGRQLLANPDARTELVLKPFDMAELLERVNAAVAVA